MKRWWFLFLIVALFLMINIVSGIRINEIEANPIGTDSKNEWIEFYSENETSLDGWVIRNHDNNSKDYNLTGNFTGYLAINFTIQYLDNSNESVYLLNQSRSIIDYLLYFNDSVSGGNDTTWQYCETFGWIMKNSTRAQANNCTITQNNTNSTNNTSNNTSNTNNGTSQTNITNNTTQTLSLEINSQESAYTDEEIEITININNMLSTNYDIKATIINKDNKVISETYNEEESLWASSVYYIENYFVGPGNSTKKITIRIPTKNREYGDLTINIRARKRGSTSYTETSKNIEILESSIEEKNVTTKNEQSSQGTTKTLGESQNSMTGKVVYLNGDIDASKGIKSNNIYRSKNDKIKEYTIYAFAGFCVLIIIYQLIKK